VKRVLIGGIGNVLLGDDGVGPYVVRLLESLYQFGNDVEIVDLGTPALDLVDQISGREVVILVDSIDAGVAHGAVQLYRKEDIVKPGASARWDTHSPALIDTLLGADFLGLAPASLLLVGIQAQSFDAGCALSESVKVGASRAIAEIVRELDRTNVGYHPRQIPAALDLWWADDDVEKSAPQEAGAAFH